MCQRKGTGVGLFWGAVWGVVGLAIIASLAPVVIDGVVDTVERAVVAKKRIEKAKA